MVRIEIYEDSVLSDSLKEIVHVIDKYFLF